MKAISFARRCHWPCLNSPKHDPDDEEEDDEEDDDDEEDEDDEEAEPSKGA